MDKALTVLLFVVALAVAFVLGRRTRDDAGQPPATVAAPTAPPAVAPPPAPVQAAPLARPAPGPKIQMKPPTEAKKPDAVRDRDLNQPLPRSVQEILATPRTFAEPELPGRPGVYDGDVTTVYRGFYEARSGKYRRIQVNNTGGRNVKLEEINGRYSEWTSDDFDLANFNGDPYSYVYFLPGHTLYLKFATKQVVKGYDDEFRSLRGWLIGPQGRAHPVALLDGWMPELEAVATKGTYNWPSLGAVQALLPAPLAFNASLSPVK